MSFDAAVGVLVVVTGAVLVAAGVLWKGRAVRPLAPRRARSIAWERYVRALTRSAELAIASARGAAGRGEPAIVTVESVVRLAHERFGYEEVNRAHAAAALRHAYERGRCAADCMTDAYSSIQ
ncbi:hypothetical protein ACIGEZ_22640 [Streptomyces sp. NPDC085481]|uniref:hypothetical protein n=1 Tax=Streptomyces sp. NPDC085481 TaxID=3365727 RepID=UPI0037D2A69F